MACRAIRDALGWDKPGPNGNYYRWELQAAIWTRLRNVVHRMKHS